MSSNKKTEHILGQSKGYVEAGGRASESRLAKYFLLGVAAAVVLGGVSAHRIYTEHQQSFVASAGQTKEVEIANNQDAQALIKTIPEFLNSTPLVLAGKDASGRFSVEQVTQAWFDTGMTPTHMKRALEAMHQLGAVQKMELNAISLSDLERTHQSMKMLKYDLGEFAYALNGKESIAPVLQDAKEIKELVNQYQQDPLVAISFQPPPIKNKFKM